MFIVHYVSVQLTVISLAPQSLSLQTQSTILAAALNLNGFFLRLLN